MTTTSYQGWTNYETWTTSLWLNQDYNFYAYRVERVKEIVSEEDGEADAIHAISLWLRDYVHEEVALLQEKNVSGFLMDIVEAATHDINYNEIAESWYEEFAESTALEGK